MKAPLDPLGERSPAGFLLVGSVLCDVCVRPVPRSSAWSVSGPAGDVRRGHRECLGRDRDRGERTNGVSAT